MSNYRVEFDVELYNLPGDRPHSSRCLQYMLDALMLIDLDWLITHPDTPRLYDSGVRYMAEDPRRPAEKWQSIPTLFRRKKGDCEDIATARAAELNLHGIAARPYYSWREFPPRIPGGPTRLLYHIRTEYPCKVCNQCHRYERFMNRQPLACKAPDGVIEDPCIVLGMPSDHSRVIATSGTEPIIHRASFAPLFGLNGYAQLTV